jgi:4-hydroxy-4-methyl-2-oxoglutarate aldolase
MAFESMLRDIPVALLADTMDDLGFVDYALDPRICLLVGTVPRVFGAALCVSGRAGTGDNARFFDIDDAITPGCVVVVDTGNSSDVAVIGGNAAVAFRRKGCAGIVVDGCVRDGREFAMMDLPCFSRGVAVRSLKGRWEYTNIGEPISVSGATGTPVMVHSGDIVSGDEDGVVILPAASLEKIASRSLSLKQLQAAIKVDLDRGSDRRSTYAKHKLKY